MESILIDVNWWAVIVGTVVSFILGWIWYSEILFAKGWQIGIGISVDDQTPMWPAMLAQLAGTFLLAWVVGVTASTGNLYLAGLISITIVSIITANGLFTQKSGYAIRVEVGYILLMTIVMVGVHTIL